MLEDEGIVSTQATISRDLEEIGAVKVKLPGGISGYAIPESAKRPGADGTLSKILRQYVLSVDALAPLVVIRTPMGCADVTCAAIDTARLEEISGTIAGQDTVFLAIYPDADIEELVNKLRELSDISLA